MMQNRLNEVSKMISDGKAIDAYNEIESILNDKECQKTCNAKACETLIQYWSQLCRSPLFTKLSNNQLSKHDLFFYHIKRDFIAKQLPKDRSKLLFRIAESYTEKEIQSLWYLIEALEYEPDNLTFLQRLSLLENHQYLIHYAPFSQLVSELTELKKTLPSLVQQFLKQKNKSYQTCCDLIKKVKNLVRYQHDKAELKTLYQYYQTFLIHYSENLQRRLELFYLRIKDPDLGKEELPVETLEDLVHEFADSLALIVGWENKLELSNPSQPIGQALRKIWQVFINECNNFPEHLSQAINHIKQITVSLNNCIFPQQLYSNLWQAHRSQHHQLKKAFFETQNNDELKRHEAFQRSLITLLGKYIKELARSVVAAPCDWTLCLMGSGARGDMSPYSDLDITLIIADDKYLNHAYFKAILNGFQTYIIALGGFWEWDQTKGACGFQGLGFRVDEGDLNALPYMTLQPIQTPTQLAERVASALQKPEQLHDFMLAFSLLVIKPIYATHTQLVDHYYEKLNAFQQSINFKQIGWQLLKSVALDVSRLKEKATANNHAQDNNNHDQTESQLILKDYIKPLHLIMLACYCMEAKPEFASFNWQAAYQTFPQHINVNWAKGWIVSLQTLYSYRRELQNEMPLAEISISQLKPPNANTVLITLQKQFKLFFGSLPQDAAQFHAALYCPHQAYIKQHFAKPQPQHMDEILALLKQAIDYQEQIDLPSELINAVWHWQAQQVLSKQFQDLSTLNVLIQSGADPDLPLLLSVNINNNNNNQSPLSLIEHAYQQKNIQAMIDLIQLGAGRKVHFPIESWLEFLNQSNIAKNTLQSCLETWAKRNMRLNWRLTQESLFEPVPQTAFKNGVFDKALLKPDERKQFMIGLMMGPVLLKETVWQSIFQTPQTGFLNLWKTNATTIEMKRHNQHYGRRAVACYITPDKQWRFYFKSFPEAPGIEDAVQQLAHAYFINTVPFTELFHYQDEQGNSIPILISQGINGYNLQDVLNALSDDPKVRDLVKDKITMEQAKTCLANIDHYSFSQHLLLTLLTNDEDGKPDNKYLMPFQQGNQTFYRIISIDNDHIFLESIILDNQGKHQLQLKSILFCLDNMQRPLHSQAVSEFLRIKGIEAIESWLEKLQVSQHHLEKLFDGPKDKPNTIRKKLLDSGSILTMTFPKRSMAKLWEKWERAHQALNKEPQILGLDLLRFVMPFIGVRYMHAFEQHTPFARFHQIASKSYTSVFVNKLHVGYQTKSQSAQLLLIQGVKKEALYQKGKSFGPKEALDEIRLAKQEHLHLEKILQQVQQGQFEAVQTLHLDNNKAKVISQLNWQCLSKDQQTRFLQAIIKHGLNTERLVLKHCAVLDDTTLELLLKTMPGLQQFTLEHSTITDKVWSLLENYCPALEKLSLTYLPSLITTERGLLTITQPQFLELNTLTIQQVPQLTTLKFMAPQLKHLTVSNTSLLQAIQTQSRVLETLVVPDSPLLTFTGLSNAFETMLPLKYGYLPAHWQKDTSLILYYHYPFLLARECAFWIKQFTPSVLTLLTSISREKVTSETYRDLKQIIVLHVQQLTYADALLQALRDKEWGVRKAASQALTVLAVTYSPRPAALWKYRYDVRGAAAQALGKVTAIDREVRMALLKALENSDVYVRRAAAQALGKVAVTDSEVREALWKALGDSWYEVRRAAAQSLGKTAVTDSSVRAELLKTLENEDSSVRLAAVHGLGKVGVTDSSVREMLLKILEDRTDDRRGAAAQALGKVAVTDSSVRVALLKALEDSTNDIRGAAAQALGKIAVTDSSVRAQLLKVLRASRWQVRKAALQALEKTCKSLNHQYQPLYQSLKKIADEQQATLAFSMKLTELRDTITNNLASLNLLANDELHEQALISVLKKAANITHQLQFIRIGGIQTQQKEALAFIQQIVLNNSELTTLDLGQNHFGDELMESLLTQTLPSCKKLSILMLHENDLTQAVAVMKAVGLLLIHCPIEDLVLGGNKIEAEGIGMLMQAVSNSTNCVLDTAPSRGMTRTERGITREKHEKRATVELKSLSLSGNPMGAKGLQYLASSQHLNLSDAALYLDNTQLDDNAWSALESLLPKVRLISLKHNQLKDIKPLIDLFPKCASLQQIYLEGNLFSKKDLKSLYNTLEKLYPNSRLSKSIQQAIDQLSLAKLLLLKPPSSSSSNTNSQNTDKQEDDVKEGKQEIKYS